MDLKQRIDLTHQTLDALEAINNNGGKVPDGHVLECCVDDQWGRSSYPMTGLDPESHYRLTPIPQHRRVPFTLADFVPGSVFSFNPVSGWFYADVNQNGISYMRGGSWRIALWQDLMDEECQVRRPDGTWQPCWKEVTE